MSTDANAEAAWFTCGDPRAMWGLLRGKERGRKFRLFASACCRRVEHLLTDERSLRALEVFERFLDGQLTLKEYDAGSRKAAEACADLARVVGAGESAPGTSEADHVRMFASMLAAQAVADCFGSVATAPVDCCGALRGYGTAELTDDGQLRDAGDRIEADERIAQAALLRDIFGNPFHAVAFDPAWRTDAVVALARKMCEERDFDEMPDLADALQEAGCENERILDHCCYASLLSAEPNSSVAATRRTRPAAHVRGCWVCDLVLGKE